MTAAAPTVDERVARTPVLSRLLSRPELGAVIGAVLVFIFFAVITESFATPDGIANFLDPASTLGIMAVAVALLMIGGEFDLSAGVMTGSTGLILASLATHWGWNVWPAMAVSLVFALLVGLLNGVLVMRTGLPSFIVTLGTFLMLQGLNLGVTKVITGTVQVRGLDEAGGYGSAGYLFASTFPIFGTEVRIAVLWWLLITVIGTWVLLRTRPGNWIFSSGGAAPSARSVGVPVARTKIGLFMTVSAMGWLVGTITALRFTSVQANAGIGLEFEFIIAAVIGGCLLTGGYGSAIGAAIGALIFGMTKQGIVYANWDSDWFKFFLGLMLLGATLVNTFVRRRAMRSRE
jgi:simple sugar transport system permease protein